MGKPKGLKDRLFGAAVLKMSFRLRGDELSPAFHAFGTVVGFQPLRSVCLWKPCRSPWLAVSRRNSHSPFMRYRFVGPSL